MAQANRDETQVPSFGLKLNGKDAGVEVEPWVANVTIEDDLDLPSMFEFELIRGEGEDETDLWVDDDRFALGTTVEISMGYGEERDALITGEITSLEPAFSVSSLPTLIVRGYDKRHRLNGPRRTRSFVDQKDSDIASQIGSEAGLTVDATDSGVTHPYLLQVDQTDLGFLQERARRIQYELAMDGESLLFRPVANAEAEQATLAFVEDLLEFTPRLTLVPVTELKVRGWDPKEKQAITASAKAGDEVATMGGEKTAAERAGDLLSEAMETVVRAPVASQAEADQMAAGRFNAASLGLIRGDGRCLGRTDVRAGRVIRIDDIGARFSGRYYVVSAKHRYSKSGGYITQFRVRRNAS